MAVIGPVSLTGASLRLGLPMWALRSTHCPRYIPLSRRRGHQGLRSIAGTSIALLPERPITCCPACKMGNPPRPAWDLLTTGRLHVLSPLTRSLCSNSPGLRKGQNQPATIPPNGVSLVVPGQPLGPCNDWLSILTPGCQGSYRLDGNEKPASTRDYALFLTNFLAKAMTNRGGGLRGLDGDRPDSVAPRANNPETAGQHRFKQARRRRPRPWPSGAPAPT